jgi:hypothetical protein
MFRNKYHVCDPNIQNEGGQEYRVRLKKACGLPAWSKNGDYPPAE